MGGCKYAIRHHCLLLRSSDRGMFRPLLAIIGFYNSRSILPGHRSRPLNRPNSFSLTKHKTLLLCQTPQINIEPKKTWKTTTLSRRQSHCAFHNSFRADCYTLIDTISTGWSTRCSSIRLVSHAGARFINILFFTNHTAVQCFLNYDLTNLCSWV